VCLLMLRSFKIISEKILQSQVLPELFWGRTEAKLRQKRQILSVFSEFICTIPLYQYSSARG
jgi:hypothetical protein